MIQTILFATDLGVFSAHILQHVMALANKCDARIVVLHVVEPLGSFANAVVKTYLSPESSQDIQQEGLSKMMKTIKGTIIDELANEYMEGEQSLARIKEVSVVQGRPAEVILDQAQKQQVDMIVMGSHGPNTMSSNLLGSVISKVLQLAKVPVYMVPMIDPSTLSSVQHQPQIPLWG